MNRSILVAESDTNCRNRLSRLFRRQGFRTYTAETGDGAIEIVRKTMGAIDVGVLEMFLPDFSALELLGIMRRHRSEVPTVIVVEDDSKEIRMKALSAGAYAVIRKSFADDVVEQTIKNILRKFFQS